MAKKTTINDYKDRWSSPTVTNFKPPKKKTVKPNSTKGKGTNGKGK